MVLRFQAARMSYIWIYLDLQLTKQVYNSVYIYILIYVNYVLIISKHIKQLKYLKMDGTSYSSTGLYILSHIHVNDIGGNIPMLLQTNLILGVRHG